MDKNTFHIIEQFMLEKAGDSAHDRAHIERVLFGALDIARYEENADLDVLIAACLLHDIARPLQAKDERVCHARAGAEMAYGFLNQIGWCEDKAAHVRDSIRTHRFRIDDTPATIEAKILYDSDKLDVTGALGIARTLQYGGSMSEPLYALDENGGILLEGGGADVSTFFQEYHFKLKKLYGRFYTERAAALAQEREKTMTDFCDALYREVSETLKNGRAALDEALAE
ncbi:MAG TPA: HD domain-containing protein [Clostridia bacterium]|nr:HD domain-containing protein [Clostridia bacterium]